MINQPYGKTPEGLYLPVANPVAQGSLTLKSSLGGMPQSFSIATEDGLQISWNGRVNSFRFSPDQFYASGTGGSFSFSNLRLTNLASPVYGQDAATKEYVDNAIAEVLGK